MPPNWTTSYQSGANATPKGISLLPSFVMIVATGANFYYWTAAAAALCAAGPSIMPSQTVTTRGRGPYKPVAKVDFTIWVNKLILLHTLKKYDCAPSALGTFASASTAIC